MSLLSAPGAVSDPQQAQSLDFVKSNELNSEAVKLFNQGKYDEALPLATQALALREKALGPDHAELIPILTNIGEIYKRKDLDQSIAYFNRALKLAEKTYGQNDVRLATILDQLAFVEYTRKHATTAENLFMRSLKVKESALDAHDPEIARTAFNLGQAYAARAYYKGAASMLSRAITIWESAGDKERPNLLKALESQVLVLTALGKNDEAARVQHRLGELSSQDAIVNGGILNGKALVLIRPAYPLVTGFHPSGMVHVQVLIDENGQVLTAKAVNSKMQIEFVRAAESAARQSRFSPTFVDGRPVKVNGTIIYNFVAR
ncbi:MAG TPA: TonB family protein [Pyrinomonadaceae bacterium]|nr:TonB family protein [Pyrinomonadaceae bacterium]